MERIKTIGEKLASVEHLPTISGINFCTKQNNSLEIVEFKNRNLASNRTIRNQMKKNGKKIKKEKGKQLQKEAKKTVKAKKK